MVGPVVGLMIWTTVLYDFAARAKSGGLLTTANASVAEMGWPIAVDWRGMGFADSSRVTASRDVGEPLVEVCFFSQVLID